MLGVLGALGLGTGAACGVLVYANYDPVFTNKVDDKVPGFSVMTHKAADLWVNVLDYFRPKPGIPVKVSKDSKLVYEYSGVKKVIDTDTIKLSTSSEEVPDSGRTSPKASPSQLISPTEVEANMPAAVVEESTPQSPAADDPAAPEQPTSATPAVTDNVSATDQGTSEMKVAVGSKEAPLDVRTLCVLCSKNDYYRGGVLLISREFLFIVNCEQ